MQAPRYATIDYSHHKQQAELLRRATRQACLLRCWRAPARIAAAVYGAARKVMAFWNIPPLGVVDRPGRGIDKV
jgi:hypothetical protein